MLGLYVQTSKSCSKQHQLPTTRYLRSEHKAQVLLRRVCNNILISVFKRKGTCLSLFATNIYEATSFNTPLNANIFLLSIKNYINLQRGGVSQLWFRTILILSVVTPYTLVKHAWHDDYVTESFNKACPGFRDVCAAMRNSRNTYRTIQRSSVIVTVIRVTIGYSDSFCSPKKDLFILKIFWCCECQCNRRLLYSLRDSVLHSVRGDWGEGKDRRDAGSLLTWRRPPLGCCHI